MDTKLSSYFVKLPSKLPTCIRIFEKKTQLLFVGDEDVKNVLTNIYKNSVLTRAENIPVCIILDKEQNKLSDVLVNLIFAHHYKIELHTLDIDWKLTATATPGSTQMIDEIIESAKEDVQHGDSSVCALKISVLPGGRQQVDIALIHYSTSTIFYGSFEDSKCFKNLESLFVRYPPRECAYTIINKGHSKMLTEKFFKMCKRHHVFTNEVAQSTFNTNKLESILQHLLIEDSFERNKKLLMTSQWKEPMSCLVALAEELRLLRKEDHKTKYVIRKLNVTSHMRLDSSALESLHLIGEEESSLSNINNNRSRVDSLYKLLNKCKTYRGSCLLKSWIKQPLLDVNHINERLDIVQLFITWTTVKDGLTASLKNIPDLEKMAFRLHQKRVTMKDLYQISQAESKIKDICVLLDEERVKLEDAQQSLVFVTLIQPLASCLHQISPLIELISQLIKSDALDTYSYEMNPNIDEELTSLDESMQNMWEEMEEMREETFGLFIKKDKNITIKIEKAPLSGYVYKIQCKYGKLVDTFHGKYTMLETVKSGVRFSCKRLMRLSERYIDTKKQYRLKEEEILVSTREVVKNYYEPIMELSAALSQLDVLFAFANVVLQSASTYVKPKVHPMTSQRNERIRLTKCRHPMVEVQEGVSFVANDALLDRENQNFLVITGPNMGGKSTYIRQVGMSVVMAQIGCYVPCDDAEICVIDSILTRMGAGDKQTEGVSTFLAEMLDTSYIIDSATKNSLVIIDELGRGTSTFDGFGLAYSISKHLSTKVGCSCLFATHYHEMGQLKVAAAKNYHMRAMVDGDDVIMLHQLAPGSCEQSYGINVARSVDFPAHVVEAAVKNAEKLENFVDKNKYESSVVEEGCSMIKQFATQIKSTDWSSINLSERKQKIKSLKDAIKNTDNKYFKDLVFSRPKA